jgi:hypothetical protein
MAPAPGRLLHVTERYALAHDVGHTWAGAEGFRLAGHDVEAAVDEVHAMVRGRAERCSWWLTERSTPADLEERLLALGIAPEDDDYLHAGMLLTREPPRVDDIEVRQVATLAEYAEARRLAYDAFANPHPRVPTGDELAIQWEREIDPTYAAWIDGRLASVGRAIFTRAGVYLIGGATAEWARGRGAYRAVVRARWDAAVERGTPALAVGAGSMSRPILERLGFEQVLQFRRLELLLTTA